MIHTNRIQSNVVKKPINPIVFFAVEGKAEEEYVKKLFKFIKFKTGITIIHQILQKNEKNDPHSCVNRLITAKNKKQKNKSPKDLFVAICDFDDFNKKGKNNKSNLDRAIQKAKDDEILLLISNICFEQWLQSHIEDKRYQKDSTNKKELKKIILDKNNIKKAYDLAKNKDDVKNNFPTSYGSRMWILFDKIKENFPEVNNFFKKCTTSFS